MSLLCWQQCVCIFFIITKFTRFLYLSQLETEIPIHSELIIAANIFLSCHFNWQNPQSLATKEKLLLSEM